MTLQTPIAQIFLSFALIILSLSFFRRWPDKWFLLINATFLFILFRKSMGSLSFLVVSLFFHYVILQVMIWVVNPRVRTSIYWSWVAITLVGFVAVKEYWWLTDFFIERSFLPQGLETVGYSFILFRMLHLAIETRDGALTSIPIYKYLNFNLAFWTFLAGPIQRFKPFCIEFNKIATTSSELPAREVLLGLNRALFGFIKMFVLGKYLANGFSSMPVPQAELFTRILPLIAFPLHMYVNFSGYCDIMIGFARAVGFALPENFRQPYLARNSLDFWNRWHISLSEFFRDYIYFPLHTSMSRRISSFPSLIIATLCSFTVMGAWHGSSLRFAIFGLIHAGGVITVLLYQKLLKKAMGKERLHQYQHNRAIKWVAIASFQTFVILSFIPFQYDLSVLPTVLRAIMGWGNPQ